jgi:hypothetical protein
VVFSDNDITRQLERGKRAGATAIVVAAAIVLVVVLYVVLGNAPARLQTR